MSGVFPSRRSVAGLAGLVLLFGAASAWSAAPEPVDIELVIATDVSPSIDASEARLQRDGIVAAFMSPEIVAAIQGGSLGKIAVAAIDFSSREYNKVVVNWQIVQDKATATAFAEKMRIAPTTTGQHTSISEAIELATLLIEQNQLHGTKKVIDISGDGPNNWGRPANVARDTALMRGIVINGLPILGSASDLENYYANCVVGGPGSFTVAAHGFADFARAIRNKLIQEIASAAPAAPQQERNLLIRTAAGAPRLGYAPPLNEKGCENAFGGFPPFSGFDFPLPVPR